MKLLPILFLISSVLTYSQENNRKESQIKWTKDTKLEWSDYKAEPNTKVLAYAQTSYKIEIIPEDVIVDENNNIQNYESIEVIANFYPHHSWVLNKDDFLLKHEQLHFDIAGLYALKVNAEFKKLIAQKNANFNSYFKVYEKLWAECRATQKRYDSETNHGQIAEENEKWIKKVSQEISSFFN